MTSWFRFSLLGFSLFLAGCPQGSAHDVFRLDGGDDAEAGVAEENDAGGAGALCGIDGKNECGSLSACDPKLGCVECRADDDCPIAAAHCLLGACVGCRPGKTDCPEGSACSTEDFDCHPRCVGPGTCAGATVCDEPRQRPTSLAKPRGVGSGECVGCLGAEGCAGMVCSTEKRQCVECVEDSSCPKSKPRCRVVTGQCVRCRSNDDCGLAAPTCDPTTFECRSSVSDAPSRPDAGTE